MESNTQTQAVELLQELGLKEYESKCFVALSRMPKGTAKEISGVTDVPRTRVYDAIRVLEAKGLVEVQHTSPRQYRAVSIDEATSLLTLEYESRVETLEQRLNDLPPTDGSGGSPSVGEIWSINNHESITTRAIRLVSEASSEIVIVVGDLDSLSEEFFRSLRDAADRGVSVRIGVLDEVTETSIRDDVGAAEVFLTKLPWFPKRSDSAALITRLMLVDFDTVLVGTRAASDEPEHAEQAVVGNGSSNGLVVILRYLLRSGFLGGSEEDPQ